MFTNALQTYEKIRRLAPEFARSTKQIAAQAHNEAEAAARLWGLTDEELADIQTSLKELKG